MSVTLEDKSLVLRLVRERGGVSIPLLQRHTKRSYADCKEMYEEWGKPKEVIDNSKWFRK